MATKNSEMVKDKMGNTKVSFDVNPKTPRVAPKVEQFEFKTLMKQRTMMKQPSNNMLQKMKTLKLAKTRQ